MDFDELVRLAAQKSKLSVDEVRHNIAAKKAEFAGLIDEVSAAKLVLRDLNVKVFEPQPKLDFSTIVAVAAGKLPEPNVIARVVQINSPKEFESDGKSGMVCNIEVADSTGKATLVFWDEDVRWMEGKGIERGDVLELIGLGVKNFNPLELHSGAFTDVKLHKQGKGIAAEALAGLPEPAVKPADVASLREGQTVDIYLRATAVSELREFDKPGRKGMVVNVLCEDAAGNKAHAVLWDYCAQLAAKSIKVGEAVKLEGFSVRKGQSGLELHSTWSSHVVFDPHSSPIPRQQGEKGASIPISGLKSAGRGIMLAKVRRILSVSSASGKISADAELYDSSGSVVVSFSGKPALALLQLRHAPKLDINAVLALKQEHLLNSKLRLIVTKHSRANIVKYEALEVLEGGIE
ncbi:MAG: hypothetical protein V1708_03090 [Candidatus Micrarchaeota archaeon]